VAAAREPERTCVGCRERAPKRALLRIAAASGVVAVDPSGRATGRGAYVHREPSCVNAALSRGALWRALRTHADANAAARLRHEIERELSS
jgi:predicted RNA-binding protein YlxR (DUF448 family)